MTGSGGGQSYQSYYGHQEMWVCKGCKKPRSDWTPAHYAAVGVVVLVAFAFLTRHPSTPSSTDAIVANDTLENSTLITANSASAVGDGVSTGNIQATPEQAGQAPPNEQVADITPATDAVAGSAHRFDFNVEAVANAEARAVTTGKPVRWKWEGYKGYVVPSEATVAQSGMPCRNVYATVSGSGIEQQSPILRMCQSPTGDWASVDQ